MKNAFKINLSWRKGKRVLITKVFVKLKFDGHVPGKTPLNVPL